MATVIHRSTRQLLNSVHSPDFSPVDWIINPDLSALVGVPRKYWKVVGDDVLEMTPAEKSTVDSDQNTLDVYNRYTRRAAIAMDVVAAFNTEINRLVRDGVMQLADAQNFRGSNAHRNILLTILSLEFQLIDSAINAANGTLSAPVKAALVARMAEFT